MKISNLLLIIILILASCKNKGTTIVETETARVRLAPVIKRKMSIPVHSSGILAPADEIKLSFMTGGLISEIRVNEGQHVKKGDMLASLDLVAINSSVDQARKGYEKALRDFTRAENLYRDSVATLEMKQNAGTALDVSESTLEMAEYNLSHSKIIAPADGIILKQIARVNEMIAQGYPVFLFGTSGKYWKIRTGLSDRDVVRISTGDSAIVTFDAYPSVHFTAVVGEIGAMADPYTGTYETELLLKADNSKLAAGFIASVEIFPSATGVYTMIPMGSLIEADEHHGYVFVVTDSMTVRKMSVDIVGIPGESAAVTGLQDDIKKVVSEGAAYLRDGKKVVVMP